MRVKVLHKIDTRFANQQLYRHGSLQNYVEQYLNNPLRPAYEAIPGQFDRLSRKRHLSFSVRCLPCDVPQGYASVITLPRPWHLPF
ncbi:MAG: hypothetical protein MRJ92_14655 [Nitrospira sp.]|nr:hypothetical protein [Nitrospira sp.]